MKNPKAVAVSVGRLEMLAVEFLRRAVEVRERTPVQILEFSVIPKERRVGQRFKKDLFYIEIVAKFLLQYHNPGNPVPFRAEAAASEERMHDFIYEIRAAVPFDVSSETPHLVPKKWCHMEVKRSMGCFKIMIGDRGLEENWTIMLKNRREDGFFAESYDLCVHIDNGRGTSSFNWMVGNSHTGQLRTQSHYDARNA